MPVLALDCDLKYLTAVRFSPPTSIRRIQVRGVVDNSTIFLPVPLFILEDHHKFIKSCPNMAANDSEKLAQSHPPHRPIDTLFPCLAVVVLCTDDIFADLKTDSSVARRDWQILPESCFTRFKASQLH